MRSEGRQQLKVNVFYMAGKGKYQFNDEGVIGVSECEGSRRQSTGLRNKDHTEAW